MIEEWSNDFEDVPKDIMLEVIVNHRRKIKAKFDNNLNICTDFDVNKIRLINRWRALKEREL